MKLRRARPAWSNVSRIGVSTARGCIVARFVLLCTGVWMLARVSLAMSKYSDEGYSVACTTQLGRRSPPCLETDLCTRVGPQA